ncbi:DNA-protecting protein DprA [Candidatus Campbellbacteria bacterium CG11_big_fil_rev_8_21_14_0_20_44_21]|nr:MAG: DNA-protecting protein DprA [Candidatus Campbellbacteria bacterium CG11_big_fil_rev_8_21_14_0_20_44_21]
MGYEVRELLVEDFPSLLHQIEDPPENLFISGSLPGPEYKFLCVVGSRKYSPYGKEVCQKLLSGLAGENIAIVSGLAMGIDTIAHEAALAAGLKTVAVPGSGLDESVLYPRTNLGLAKRIVASGGALLSEFELKFRPAPWNFPQRNRIMAGMSEGALIIEAEEKSGTLITARLSMEYNREVMVVPGGILSQNSFGSNNLLKDGARPVFSSEDILEALGLEKKEKEEKDYKNMGPEEKIIMERLRQPMAKEELIALLDMPVTKINILLSSLEIKGIIKESYGKIVLK